MWSYRAVAHDGIQTALNCLPNTTNHKCVAQVCRDGLDAHSARVAELRAMVAEIADEVGCDAADLLRGEVDALGRRLESVRESISTLADIAEAQAANQVECGRNLEQAKSYLSGMQEVSAVG